MSAAAKSRMLEFARLESLYREALAEYSVVLQQNLALTTRRLEIELRIANINTSLHLMGVCR